MSRARTPLDNARLEELALAYVARFATNRAKLERYLKRKLYERGWAGEGEPDAAAIARRFAEAGYIDDAAYARARSDSLTRRGYGPRRVAQTLGQDGIDQDLREEVAPGEAAARRACFRLARKRRFGPFCGKAIERDEREKQLAAMLRAGHSLDNARQMLDCTDPEAAEQWASELDDEDGDGEVW